MQISISLLTLLGLVSIAAADIPRKAPLSRYSTLSTNSPFTSKPPPVENGEDPNILDDYALIGVSPIGGNGYRVTIINKKKPEDRIKIDSDDPKAEFQVLGVTRKEGNPLGTVVSLGHGSTKGTVAFDEKLLTLVTPKPAAPQPQQPPIPGQPIPPPAMPNNGQPFPGRQPRPRVIPPPTQQPAVQQIHQAQPSSQSQQDSRQRGSRPSRRGGN
jgi:hypothetical protein